MKYVDHPDATRRLLNALSYAGVTEVVLDDNIKLSVLLLANGVTYHELIFNSNFRKMRENLNRLVINEDDTLGQIITKVHNAM